MLLGPLDGDSALPFQPDMTVRIDQAWHQPDSGCHGLRIGNRLCTDHSVDHPQVAMFAFW
jgi:hypothetical protein